MDNKYVEERGGGYYVRGTRVGLDSVILSYKDGETPGEILEAFSALKSVEIIEGVIQFYLNNKDLVEAYLEDQNRLDTELAAIQAQDHSPVLERLRRMKAELLLKQA